MAQIISLVHLFISLSFPAAVSLAAVCVFCTRQPNAVLMSELDSYGEARDKSQLKCIRVSVTVD